MNDKRVNEVMKQIFNPKDALHELIESISPSKPICPHIPFHVPNKNFTFNEESHE